MQSISWAQLFRESVIFQGLLALVCLIGTFVLLFAERPVPDYIWVIDATALGFFFGAKNLLSARNAAQEANRTTQILAAQNAELLQTFARMGMGVGGPVGAAISQATHNWQGDDPLVI